jgi:polyisoprenoid-binding protein YceI
MAAMATAQVSSKQVYVPAAGRYRIDQERSTVKFATRHFFGALPVRGTFALRDGVINVADPVTGSAVWARISAPSFHTGNPIRDTTVLSKKLLDAETYPNLLFSSTTLVLEQEEWRLRGELEVRGVTQLTEVRIGAVSVDDAGATVCATARAVIDRHAFGVSAFRGMVAGRLTVDFDIVAHRATA